MKNLRYSILVFNKFYLPGFKAGGPVRTIANLVDRLGAEFDFRVVTSDRDAGDDNSYQGIIGNEWNSVGGSKVRYLEPQAVSLRVLADLINKSEPDSIYLNSFFDSLFTQRVLLLSKLRRIPRIPIILASRGEFSKGALAIKRQKKLVYILLARLVGLYKDVTWQASSELEKTAIQSVFPSVKDEQIYIATNLAPAIDRTNHSAYESKTSGILKAVFLSRLSPMKNLDFALRVLRKVTAQVEFTIYGPKEVPAYWKECEGLITDLPDNIKVSWQGEVTHENVHETLSGHDLFFFPTRGENYGHVIHEALSSGLPVLISDQTPWRDLEAAGVGWVLPLNAPEEFARQIDEVAQWESEKLTEVSLTVRQYAANMARDDSALEANRALFLTAIEARTQ